MQVRQRKRGNIHVGLVDLSGLMVALGICVFSCGCYVAMEVDAVIVKARQFAESRLQMQRAKSQHDNKVLSAVWAGSRQRGTFS
jgi:hypothetical protein